MLAPLVEGLDEAAFDRATGGRHV